MTCEILLGRRLDKVALVSDEDFERVNALKWYAQFQNQSWYAVRGHPNHPTGFVRMHRFILDVTDLAILVDHKDQNGLNNQRDNIRIATRGQNQQNRKTNVDNLLQLKGVKECGGGFIARIQVDGKREYLGYFHTAEEAKAAYDKAALERHGDFARLQ